MDKGKQGWTKSGQRAENSGHRPDKAEQTKARPSPVRRPGQRWTKSSRGVDKGKAKADTKTHTQPQPQFESKKRMQSCTWNVQLYWTLLQKPLLELLLCRSYLSRWNMRNPICMRAGVARLHSASACTSAKTCLFKFCCQQRPYSGRIRVLSTTSNNNPFKICPPLRYYSAWAHCLA